MAPIASIIIPTFKRNEIANTCLTSILNSNLNNIEIIVINDDKETEFRLDKFNTNSTVKIYDNPKSGVASARNLGAKLATSPILIFIDDDMIINKEALEKAILFLNTTKNSTYNANWEYEEKLVRDISKEQFGRYLIKNNFTSLKGWNDNMVEWKKNSLLKTNGITSQFWAIKKTDFEIIGGYNENFPFAGFEDHAISLSLKEQFITNYIDTSVIIYHNELDRLNPPNWLERKKRGAITRKTAVKMGYTDLSINYPPIKKTILNSLLVVKPALMLFLSLVPNLVVFDPLYFKFINLLIALNIYEGYNKD